MCAGSSTFQQPYVTPLKPLWTRSWLREVPLREKLGQRVVDRSNLARQLGALSDYLGPLEYDFEEESLGSRTCIQIHNKLYLSCGGPEDLVQHIRSAKNEQNQCDGQE